MNMGQILRGPVTLGLALALAISACTATGTGTGSSRRNDIKADFAWRSEGGMTGTLTASMNNGETFSGKFFQVTSESRIDDLGPLWGGWSPRWRGWSYWGSQPTAAFVTHYSGRVVANLEGPNAEHMRCHFQLIRPTSGMAGGGDGQCQMPTGQTIHATFARS